MSITSLGYQADCDKCGVFLDKDDMPVFHDELLEYLDVLGWLVVDSIFQPCYCPTCAKKESE